MPFTLGSLCVGVVILWLTPPPVTSFSRGAGHASCREMSPGHIHAHPQRPQHGYVSVLTSAASYLPGQLVTVKVRSSRDFMGFLLQARRAAEVVGGGLGVVGRINQSEPAGAEPAPGGSWVLAPPGSHTMRCLSEADAVTHSDKRLKRNLSFAWRAPGAAVGDVQFHVTVVQSYFVYWAGIRSAVLHDGSRSSHSVTEGHALPGFRRQTATLSGGRRPSFNGSLPTRTVVPQTDFAPPSLFDTTSNTTEEEGSHPADRPRPLSLSPAADVVPVVPPQDEETDREHKAVRLRVATATTPSASLAVHLRNVPAPQNPKASVEERNGSVQRDAASPTSRPEPLRVQTASQHKTSPTSSKAPPEPPSRLRRPSPTAAPQSGAPPLASGAPPLASGSEVPAQSSRGPERLDLSAFHQTGSETEPTPTGADRYPIGAPVIRTAAPPRAPRPLTPGLTPPSDPPDVPNEAEERPNRNATLQTTGLVPGSGSSEESDSASARLHSSSSSSLARPSPPHPSVGSPSTRPSHGPTRFRPGTTLAPPPPPPPSLSPFSVPPHPSSPLSEPSAASSSIPSSPIPSSSIPSSPIPSSSIPSSNPSSSIHSSPIPSSPIPSSPIPSSPIPSSPNPSSSIPSSSIHSSPIPSSPIPSSPIPSSSNPSSSIHSSPIPSSPIPSSPIPSSPIPSSSIHSSPNPSSSIPSSPIPSSPNPSSSIPSSPIPSSPNPSSSIPSSPIPSSPIPSSSIHSSPNPSSSIPSSPIPSSPIPSSSHPSSSPLISTSSSFSSSPSPSLSSATSISSSQGSSPSFAPSWGFSAPPHPPEPPPAPRRSLTTPLTPSSRPLDSDPRLEKTTPRVSVHPNPKPHPNLEPNPPEQDAPPGPPAGTPGGGGKYPAVVARHSDWELGMLLGCSAGLGMALVVALRYVRRQACGKRTAVTLNDREREYGRGERGPVHVQECRDLVRVRKIRENSFVLLAEYDILAAQGDERPPR